MLRAAPVRNRPDRDLPPDVQHRDGARRMNPLHWTAAEWSLAMIVLSIVGIRELFDRRRKMKERLK